jgi:drug/metabolite transporter (DMT)-like permease
VNSSRDPQCRVLERKLRLFHCVSVFSCLPESVLLLIGILSVVVLKRKLRLFHWLGMLLVCAGALIVGSRCSLSLSLSICLCVIVCVCVEGGRGGERERAREKESVCMCVCVNACVRAYKFIGSIVYVLGFRV